MLLSVVIPHFNHHVEFYSQYIHHSLNAFLLQDHYE